MPTVYVSSHTCWNQVSSLLGLVLFYCRTPIVFRLCYFSFPSHTSKYISLCSFSNHRIPISRPLSPHICPFTSIQIFPLVIGLIFVDFFLFVICCCHVDLYNL